MVDYMFTCSSSDESDEEVVCGGGDGLVHVTRTLSEWAVGHRQGVQQLRYITRSVNTSKTEIYNGVGQNIEVWDI